MPYKSAARLEAEAAGIGGAQHLLVDNLISGVVNAVNEAATAQVGQLVALAEVFARGLNPSERLRAHQYLGQRGQQAVLNSYAQTVTARKGPAGQTPYRMQARRPQNRRYAGGALRRALAADDFFEATADGLRFINTTRLDKEARHWARLNAGAGSVGSGSRRRFDVRFNNLVAGAFGLDMEARPAFTMPRGYWFNRAEGSVVPAGARGGDEFYPIGEGPSRVRSARRTTRKIPTRGIEARNFLDAGVARIAADLGPTYERLYERLWREGTVGPNGRVRVTAAPRVGALGARVGTHRVRHV